MTGIKTALTGTVAALGALALGTAGVTVAIAASWALGHLTR